MDETIPATKKPSFIDRISWVALVPLALFMAIAPIHPEPHLWEKLKMLGAGSLTRPLDIFDLFMHATPLVLVVVKGWRQWQARGGVS
ncbi:MAG: RND transporter [Magnetococcales bacterium]|nr:RND transporter [Magnetococcales bacterium]MBF0433846.1 RND transporter [Magnetococcales bacterium]